MCLHAEPDRPCSLHRKESSLLHALVRKDEQSILDVDPEAQRRCTPLEAPPLSIGGHAAGCDPPSMGVDPVLGGHLCVPGRAGLPRARAPLLPNQLSHPLHLHGILPSHQIALLPCPALPFTMHPGHLQKAALCSSLCIYLHESSVGPCLMILRWHQIAEQH